MARKRYRPEEIVSLLRQAEVLHGQGRSMAEAIRYSSRSRSGSPANVARTWPIGRSPVKAKT